MQSTRDTLILSSIEPKQIEKSSAFIYKYDDKKIELASNHDKKIEYQQITANIMDGNDGIDCGVELRLCYQLRRFICVQRNVTQYNNMGRKRDISEQDKSVIFALRKTGLSQTNIATHVKCSQQTVSRVLKQGPAASISRKRRNCGRKRATSARDDRQLIKIVRKNRFKSVKQLHAQWKETGVTVSSRTTCRRLHENQFDSRCPKTKPLLTAKQRCARVRWCRDRLTWGQNEWDNVLFSDESVFSLSYGDQGPRVWRTSAEAFHKDCLKRSVKFAASVMVWGCMSASGVGQLAVLRSRINAETYQEILDTFMIPSAEDLVDENFLFQQDGASSHTAKSTVRWLNDRQIATIPWPSNSPDLNPIENLWWHIKKRLREKCPASKEELITSIRLTWNSITADVCKGLVANMHDRLREVIKAKGDATKY